MEMEPKYNPKKVEEGRYQFWLDHNYFKPSENKKRKHTQLLFHHQT